MDEFPWLFEANLRLNIAAIVLVMVLSPRLAEMRRHTSFRVLVSALCAVGVLSVATLATARPAPKRQAKTSAKPQAKPTTTVKAPAPAKAEPVPATRTAVSRARTAARAKAAASARQQREASSPKFKRDALGNLVPDVRAAAAIVFNPSTGEVLWEENSHETRSIASLTKVMTAVTFVADDPDMNQPVLITRADTLNASVTHLQTGDLVTFGDLLHLTLI
ncbi:MAG: hypothetical protein WCQ64_16195, partial [Acidobacteriota bacterium]